MIYNYIIPLNVNTPPFILENTRLRIPTPKSESLNNFKIKSPQHGPINLDPAFVNN